MGKGTHRLDKLGTQNRAREDQDLGRYVLAKIRNMEFGIKIGKKRRREESKRWGTQRRTKMQTLQGESGCTQPSRKVARQGPRNGSRETDKKEEKSGKTEGKANTEITEHKDQHQGEEQRTGQATARVLLPCWGAGRHSAQVLRKVGSLGAVAGQPLHLALTCQGQPGALIPSQVAAGLSHLGVGLAQEKRTGLQVKGQERLQGSPTDIGPLSLYCQDRPHLWGVGRRVRTAE